MTETKPKLTMYEREWQTLPGVGASSPHNTLTVMTYNILNDSCMYPGWYDYCDEAIRSMEHRHLHIKEEIRHLQPDVVCMQEINIDQFKPLIEPMMDDLGYGCVVSGRDLHDRRHADGVFFKKDVFTLTRSKAITLYDALMEDLKGKGLEDLTRATLQKYLLFTHQVVLAQLHHIPSQSDIYIANTHIYWSELHVPDVQAVQACAAVKCLQEFMKGVENPCYILAGDFNTPAGRPAHQVIDDGQLNTENTELLKKIQIARDDGEMMCLIDIIPENLTVALNLKSSYKSVTGEEPRVTSCDFDYSAGQERKFSLDYIWFCPETLHVTSVLRTPSDDVITKETALPSSLFPSDHLPLVAKFVINRVE